MTQPAPLHRVRFPIRWEDTDPAGIVFYANYFRYFEDAEDDVFRAGGVTRHDLIARNRMWMPRIEAHATFNAPCRFGDVVEMSVRVPKLGRSSVRYEYELHRVEPAPRALLLAGYVVTVCVDHDTFRPRPIPEEMRRILLPE